jgi:predicted secreted protein
MLTDKETIKELGAKAQMKKMTFQDKEKELKEEIKRLSKGCGESFEQDDEEQEEEMEDEEWEE